MITKKTLAIIPARGGSKGIPRKNIINVAQKPLIAWSIIAAKKSKLIDLCVVSTDDKEIKEIAEAHGGKVPFLRPAELAEDDSPTIDAVIHVIEKMRVDNNLEFSYVMLLEPTSPIRLDGQLDEIISKAYSSPESNGVITLGEFSQSPFLARRIKNGFIEPFYSEKYNEKRRQDLPDLYFPFGVAYLVKTEILLKTRSFYPEKMLPFILKKDQCVEIDDYMDLKITENLLLKGEQ